MKVSLAQACFLAVNSRGGINGQKIKFGVRDDGGDPERMLALYESVAAEHAPVASSIR